MSELRNFPFIHEGKEFWYSRSIVSSGYVFAKYKGRWHILATQRGYGSTMTGMWNVPGGYLDHNETTQCAAQREVWEETGVLYTAPHYHLARVSSIPKGTKQHVIFSYYCNLGVVDKLPDMNNRNNEPNETMDMRWIPLDEAHLYQWISGQFKVMQYIYKTYITPNIWQRIKNRLSNQVDMGWA